MPLANRAAIATALRADVFVSVHLNSIANNASFGSCSGSPASRSEFSRAATALALVSVASADRK